ncbi:hypothetical protein [Defluviimonas salinarum]|nr:hypothetical protein [Defluviimonas salinarum]
MDPHDPHNTGIEYLYCDGDNYKVRRRVVFAGAITLEGHDRIAMAAIGGDADDRLEFIPGQVGLPDLQKSFYVREIEVIDAILASDEAAPVVNRIDTAERQRYADLRAGMAATRPRWDPDKDHPVHLIDDIGLTEEVPTDPRDIATFIREMEAVSWDLGYLPPFHAEMEANHEEWLAAQAESDEPSA